jgi:hypothetical protein
MKHIALWPLVALLIVCGQGPVSAWEFRMEGATEWRYVYRTRTGSTDIFGVMDPTAVNLGVNHLATFPTTATQVQGGSTFGILAGENNFGSDMSITEYRMTLFPTIQVNKAIKCSASVNLTSLGVWSDGQPLVAGRLSPPSGTNAGYVNSLYVPISSRPAAPDIPNTYVTIQWLKTVIKMPFADFIIGYRTSHLGMGLWKHNNGWASTSFGIRAKRGPFVFVFSPYFSRRNSDWLVGTSRNEGNSAPSRKERVRDHFGAAAAALSYASGPARIKLFCDYYREGSAPDTNQRFAALTPGIPVNPNIIRNRIHFSTNYFDGRFFLNTEVDWFNTWVSGRASGRTSGLSGEGLDVKNSWIYGIETGAVRGATKLTLNYVRATGDDPSTRTREDSLTGSTGVNDWYMRDWGYLMYHLYGTGNNFGANGYGAPYDFHHIGCRIDRALASNVNVWVMFARAWRDMPTAWTLGGDGIGGVRDFDNDDLLALQAGAANPRPCPDSARDIGWEVDLGVNWQLLENLTWNTTVAYWKPGNWWGYAFPNTASIYRANGGAAIVAADYPNATFGLGRDIDPLIAVETNLLISF